MLDQTKKTTVVKDDSQLLTKDFRISAIENPTNPIIVNFKKIATSKNRLSHDCLMQYIENDHDQITIENLPAGTWQEINQITIGLVHSKTGKPVFPKTAGVYVTRVNKILSNSNPNSNTTAKTSRMFSNFTLLQHTENSLKIVHNETKLFTLVYNTGKVETENFNLFAPAITDLLNPLPDRVFSRFYAGVEIDGKIELCQPPTLVIEFDDVRVALANDKPESIDAAKGALMVRLLAAGVNFTGSDIAELTPTIDGTDTWVDEKIKNNWYKSVKKSE